MIYAIVALSALFVGMILGRLLTGHTVPRQAGCIHIWETEEGPNISLEASDHFVDEVRDKKYIVCRVQIDEKDPQS